MSAPLQDDPINPLTMLCGTIEASPCAATLLPPAVLLVALGLRSLALHRAAEAPDERRSLGKAFAPRLRVPGALAIGLASGVVAMMLEPWLMGGTYPRTNPHLPPPVPGVAGFVLWLSVGLLAPSVAVAEWSAGYPTREGTFWLLACALRVVPLSVGLGGNATHGGAVLSFWWPWLPIELAALVLALALALEAVLSSASFAAAAARASVDTLDGGYRVSDGIGGAPASAPLASLQHDTRLHVQGLVGAAAERGGRVGLLGDVFNSSDSLDKHFPSDGTWK